MSAHLMAPGSRSAETRDRLAIHHDVAVLHFDGAGITAVGGVVFEQVRVGLRVKQVVDRHDFQGCRDGAVNGPQHQPSDAPKAIDANFGCHCSLLLGLMSRLRLRPLGLSLGSAN